jgi:hypothetical protein
LFTIGGLIFFLFLLKLYNLQKHENTKLWPKNAKCVLALSALILGEDTIDRAFEVCYEIRDMVGISSLFLKVIDLAL